MTTANLLAGAAVAAALSFPFSTAIAATITPVDPAAVTVIDQSESSGTFQTAQTFAYTDAAAYAAAIGARSVLTEGFEDPDASALGTTDGNGDVNITGDITFNTTGIVVAQNRYNPDAVANDFELRDYDGTNTGLLVSIENSADVEPGDPNAGTPVQKNQSDVTTIILPTRVDSIALIIGAPDTSQGIGNDSGTRITLSEVDAQGTTLSEAVIAFDPDTLPGVGEPDIAYAGFLGFSSDIAFNRVTLFSGAEDLSNDDDFLIDNFQFTPLETSTPVPVPAALPLLLGGLAMLGWLGRRQAGGEA